MRGIRVFDIADIEHPKLVTNVQTCRGSHTHTVVTEPGDNDNVYIYVSGTAGVRSADEVPGCADGGIDDPNTARFRLEVIKVPLAAPEQAAIVSSPRIFHGPAGRRRARVRARRRRTQRDRRRPARRPALPARRGGAGRRRRGGGVAAAAPTGPNQCHDITVYPEIGLAGGACAGSACCSTSSDAAHPVRIDAAADANMSFWHSATFSNDGTKILFTDEWGGGSAAALPRHRQAGVGRRRALHDREQQAEVPQLLQDAGAADALENCVAHNGSLIPIPGRDVMVQAWYQGGLSVFDWTDSRTRRRSRIFDRGPVDATRLVSGGSWSGVLVQRRHRQLGDRARPRHLRAGAERPHLAERARRREDGASATT